MNPETKHLHLFFFPLMAQGHMLPIIDLAKLFAARGVRATMITTPLNVPIFTRAIQRSESLSTNMITIRAITFPAKEAGLPEGLENLDLVTTPELHIKFFHAINLLQQPLEQLLQECHPNGLVADRFFPWATDLAAKHGIPRLAYRTCFFSTCAQDSVTKNKPYQNLSSDTEPFIIPGLPDHINMTKLQLHDHIRLGFENDFSRLVGSARESADRSYGNIFNSFYELEPAYAELYKKEKKAWHVGPMVLSNRNNDEKAARGKKSSIDTHECLKWLDSKKPNSVVYVCFGTVTRFPDSQLMEIAKGLEASGQEFIWVVRRDEEEEDNSENWLPEGFEERAKGKGLIIRGWAPQMLILGHKAVGGFVSHCGWNSTLEAVSAGVPMVTWPVFAEQFYNEKFVTEVLKTGVGVGVQRWVKFVGDSVKSDAIEKAVKRIMVGEEAEEIRSRSRVLGEMAKRAVEEGGSSYNDLDALIEELRSFRD
ncbi:scopoletin glucosyltransferase-like [Cornus florida]|uniref:scopoletin glucosyltransferase-like n=1 Tax=Cornus florida TaxID=4283 RepID=UPI00289EB15B|nr:scopoletin glucosyltransferase-like [Cornus florida]